MKAFYLALSHDEYDNLWEYLCNYTNPASKLILAKETSKSAHQDISGQHFHVLVDWEDKTYEAFKKTIIMKQYKLHGKSTKGQARKYGQVKGIKDINKMLSYTIKANDYRSQNYTEEELKNAYANSYEKENKQEFNDEINQYIKSNRKTFINIYQCSITHTVCTRIDFEQIEKTVLKYHMEHRDKPICYSKIQWHVSNYLQTTEPDRYDYLGDILNYLKKRI